MIQRSVFLIVSTYVIELVHHDSDVKREMEIMSCRQDLLANEWQRACFSPPQSPIIERCRELQRAATCSKSSFVMFIREGQDNSNIKSNNVITDLA